MSGQTLDFCVPAEAACLDGHFPGNPLVPGVVILDTLVRLAEQTPGLRVTGIRQCKFLQPLYPDMRCTLECLPPVDGVMQFRGTGVDGTVVKGIFSVAAGA